MILGGGNPSKTLLKKNSPPQKQRVPLSFFAAFKETYKRKQGPRPIFIRKSHTGNKRPRPSKHPASSICHDVCFPPLTEERQTSSKQNFSPHIRFRWEEMFLKGKNMEAKVLKAAYQIAFGEPISEQLTPDQLEEARRVAKAIACPGCSC